MKKTKMNKISQIILFFTLCLKLNTLGHVCIRIQFMNTFKDDLDVL